MKTLLILVSLLALVSLVRAVSEIVTNLQLIRSSTKFIQNIITTSEEAGVNEKSNISDRHRELCPKRISDVIEHMKITGLCFNGTDPHLSVCGTLRARLTECVTPVAEYNDQCLPEKSKGIAMLLVNGLLSLLNYICALSADQFLEIMDPCILATEKNEEDMRIIAERVHNLTTINFKRKVDDFSLQDMCSIGDNIGKQWNEHVNKTCTKQFSRDVFLGLFQAAYAPCIEIEKNNLINNNQ